MDAFKGIWFYTRAQLTGYVAGIIAGGAAIIGFLVMC